MKDPAHISHDELARFAYGVIDILYHDPEDNCLNPDLEWDGDTLERIAEHVARFGLRPDQKVLPKEPTTYHPIRNTYCGPNKVPLEDRDYTTIHTTPGHTNLSGEPLTDGWLGTTNDWSATALGAYPTIEAARQRVAEEYEIEPQRLVDRHTIDVDSCVLEDDEVERYNSIDLTMETWPVEDYCHGGPVDRITATTTDSELREIAEAILVAAEIDHVRLEGDVLQVLRRIRADEIEAADDDDDD